MRRMVRATETPGLVKSFNTKFLFSLLVMSLDL